MTRTLSSDDNNDIFVGADGSLAVATGLEAALFNCASAVKAQLGEMIFAMDEGLPNFQTVWNGAPNPIQFEAYLRRTLLTVTDVISVESVTVSATGGTLTYQATIKTIYGLGTLNG